MIAKDLSKLLGITERTAYNKLYRITEFKMSELEKLAKKLGVTVDTLIVIIKDGDLINVKLK